MMKNSRIITISLVLLCFLKQDGVAWVQQRRSSTSSSLSTTRLKATVERTVTRTILPPQTVAARVFINDKRPVILFDGVCNLCNNAVNLALDWDPNGHLRFAALQSEVGQALLQTHGRRANDISSIVLVNQDGAFIKSDAILKITEALSPPFVPAREAAMLGRWLVPSFLRDLIYDQVANNRYQLMGKRDICRFDADGGFNDRFVSDDLAYDTVL